MATDVASNRPFDIARMEAASFSDPSRASRQGKKRYSGLPDPALLGFNFVPPSKLLGNVRKNVDRFVFDI